MKNEIKIIIKKVPIIGSLTMFISSYLRKYLFSGSKNYWEKRYANKGNSGRGSYGKFAIFKAGIINNFVKENKIESVIEFGSGDGNQLSLFEFKKYTGLDVSLTAVKMCKERFKNDNTKKFFLYDSNQFSDKNPAFKTDLALSLDVIYHIIEDKIFDKYMRHLFSSANKFVIIYSSDRDDNKNDAPHYKNRNFSMWIDNNLKDWKLIKKIPNKYPDESSSDFFIFQKSFGHDTYPTKVVKNRAIIDRVERRLLLFINPLYNFYYILKKFGQVIIFYSLRKDFLTLYDTLVKKDISIFLTPHWEVLNKKFENNFRNSNIPLGFLKNKLIGFAMFVSGASGSMKTELENLRKKYSDDELQYLLEEEAVGLPIITSIKYHTSHNSIRHLHHLEQFIIKTGVDIDSINSVLEWGGGYGNFARIFIKVRHFSKGFTYTIIDTPLFSCIQWLYLSTVLGKDKVNIVKNETDSVIEGKINIVPIGFIEKVKIIPDLFVSTWALSESSVYSQDYVLLKDFWSARHLLIAYQESNEDLPSATRLGTKIESKKKVVKEKISFMSWPNYYLFS